ncbi:MAG: hypothetical protein AAFR73_01245 [Pseudomonadota bacterium]
MNKTYATVQMRVFFLALSDWNAGRMTWVLQGQAALAAPEEQVVPVAPEEQAAPEEQVVPEEQAAPEEQVVPGARSPMQAHPTRACCHQR